MQSMIMCDVFRCLCDDVFAMMSSAPPLSTAGLVAESGKRLAAGREHVIMSSLLPWEAFAAGGGRDFAKNPGTIKFRVTCSYNDFLLLSCEQLAYNSGHLTYLRYVPVSCIPLSL